MEDLSLHILDIAENAIRAGASLVEIYVERDTERDMLSVLIKDNGKGMDEEFLKMVHDPFVTTRTERRVGLGLPLLKQAAQETCGDLYIKSEPGGGTEVKAIFRIGHIDMKPLGDMEATIMALIVGNPEVNFIYRANIDGKKVELDTRELDKMIGQENHRSSPQALKLLRAVLVDGTQLKAIHKNREA